MKSLKSPQHLTRTVRKSQGKALSAMFFFLFSTFVGAILLSMLATASTAIFSARRKRKR